MDLISEAYARGQAARRGANATSILDLGAMVGLFVGGVFWNNTFWLLIAPSGIVEMLLSVALAGGYALILPMLLSMLAPSTPAGMVLAETRWKTIGHGIAVAAALFMCWHAFTVVWAWWRSREAVAATGQDLLMAIGTLIIFIVVPALSWVQIAPDRWVAEVLQAQQVKRLRAAQQANLMAAQIQYARAMALLKRGLANATAAERGELAATLIAMQRAENEAVDQVADQMRIITGADTGVSLLDDPHIEQQYHRLTSDMERLYAPIQAADYVELPPMHGPPAVAASAPYEPSPATEARYGLAHQDEPAPVAPRASPATAAHATVAHGGAPWRTVAHGGERYEDHAQTVREKLGKTLTAKQVAGALGVSESQAREMIAAWRDAGWLDKTNLNGHYAWRAAQ